MFGALRLINAVLPIMRHQGSGQIISVSSLLGVVALPYLSLYSSSKFALEGLMEGLRIVGLRQLLPATLFEGVYRRVFHLDATAIPTPSS